MAATYNGHAVLDVAALETRIGGQRIHKGVSFTVNAGEVVALIGASGTGKSVLVKEMIGLMRPTAGTIHVLGVDPWRSDRETVDALRRR
ncbi:MAG TPA: ATP-binding cassette domain-containing protein, partial [Burkholderiales bacterium]|nr:ATP-binding cassette domain-containing protein [Burkholderiales bacterium]